MDHSYKIYVRDLHFKDNPTDRRTFPVIQQILYDISPESFMNHLSFTSTNEGYLITHRADHELNYIFNPIIADKFAENLLKVELTRDISERRQIVIPEPPSQIFDKSEILLINEIETRNQIKIVTFKKWVSNKTGDKYFFITLDSVDSSKHITDIGSILLFNTELIAEKAKASRTTNIVRGSYYHQGSATYNRNRQGPSTYNRNSQGSFPNYNNQVLSQNYSTVIRPNTLQGSSITNSEQRHRQALSSSSTWGAHRPNYASLPDIREPPPSWKLSKQPGRNPNYYHSINGSAKNNLTIALEPDNIHSAITTHKSDLDIKSFIEATSKISETISNGMKNPEAYLAMVNESLSKQEIPTVFVSKKIC